MKKFLFKIKERWMHYCLFWSWNIIALIFLFVIIFPFMFWDLISASLEGSVPWNFAVFSYLSIFVLLGSVIIGLTKFRGEPKTLTKFFYGVETPLLFVFLLRLTLIREITFATGYLILIFILTTVVYFINLFRPKPQNKKTTDIICLIFDTIIGIFGLYLGLILIFYVLPFAWILLKHFFSFEWVAGLWELIFQSKGIILFYVMIGVVFIGFSSTVFIVLPFALIKIYITHFVNSIKKFAGRYCRKYAVIISILTLTTVVILFSITNNQPQKISFQLLKKIVLTDKDKLYIIDKSEIIKKGLVNAYLAPYRYLSSIKENNHIAMMYRETFDMNKTSAQRLQDFYNILTLPFLYKGNNLEEDRNEAEKLYAEFFDQSIMKGERNAINRAVSSTYQIDSIEAGLVDIDKSIVHLNRQTITVKEKKGFSEIEIFEIYENTTFRRQEILYYFELPENAVITGLWINDTENRDTRKKFIVSPRGAAQQVYNQEVQRRIDPSLMEQVGPRQYRLRAFPIEGKEKSKTDIKKFYLWFTYTVLNATKDYLPLPNLLEKRNVFWDKKTRRFINGEEIKKTVITWLPENYIKINENNLASNQINIAVNDKFLTAIKNNQTAINIKGKKIAVVIDNSFSMNEYKEKLYNQLSIVNEKLSAENIIKYFIGNKEASKNNIQKQDLIFFGQTQPADILLNFKNLFLKDNYNYIFFITDEGSYELSKDNKSKLNFSTPVWFIHINGSLPKAYDDTLQDIIYKSNGNICNSISSCLTKISIIENSRFKDNIISVDDLYAWIYSKKNDVNLEYKTDLASLGALKIIVQNIKILNMSELTTLDQIHSLAKKYQIVSPYSSMIVLVDEEQKQRLVEAEKKSDRFEREVETGKENASRPFNPLNIKSVPEPEEWILLIIVVSLILFALINKSKKVV